MATSESSKLVEVIELLGLPYSDAGYLTMDDPITIRMDEIIRSAAGRAACIRATEMGLPAIAGVDPMLNDALGVDYRGETQATNVAGQLVASVMRSLGYEHAGQKPMPRGSVAKTGAIWRVRSTARKPG